MTPQIDIAIEAGDWPDEARLHDLVAKAVAAAGDELALRWEEGAELSVLFTDDAHMSAINGQWRGKAKPTNVLSFPGEDRRPGDIASAMIGDLVFARETVAREALEQAKTFEDHLVHLTVHGFLHLFGYDHEDDTQAAEMEAAEIRVLQSLGIGDPYAYLDAWPDPSSATGNLV